MERCEDCNELSDALGTWNKDEPNPKTICEDCAEGRMFDLDVSERF